VEAHVILSFSKPFKGATVPLYEYACVKCGRHTDKIEPVAGPHLKKCPHCGGKVESVLTAPAIQFKGSGWYVTDYASKSGGDSGKSESGGSESKESPKEAGKESSKDTAAKDTASKDKAKDTKIKKPAAKKD
jgi:putative FmdB family regulatory protein